MDINKHFDNYKKIIALFLQSGFLFTESKLSNNSKFIGIKFEHLDLYYTLLSLNEFIRNLEKINSDSNNKIFIYFEKSFGFNKIASIIVKKFIKNQHKIVLIPTLAELNKIKADNNLNLVLFIGDATKKTIEDLTQKRFYFIHVINQNDKLPVYGIYQSFNNLITLNSVIIIFALIDIILSENNNFSKI